MIDQLRSGDVVVVWKLDRLGRYLRELIDLVSNFRVKGVEFVGLKDGIDTGTATGKFTFNILLPWQSSKGKSSGKELWLVWMLQELEEERVADELV